MESELPKTPRFTVTKVSGSMGFVEVELKPEGPLDNLRLQQMETTREELVADIYRVKIIDSSPYAGVFVADNSHIKPVQKIDLDRFNDDFL